MTGTQDICSGSSMFLKKEDVIGQLYEYARLQKFDEILGGLRSYYGFLTGELHRAKWLKDYPSFFVR